MGLQFDRRSKMFKGVLMCSAAFAVGFVPVILNLPPVPEPTVPLYFRSIDIKSINGKLERVYPRVDRTNKRDRLGEPDLTTSSAPSCAEFQNFPGRCDA